MERINIRKSIEITSADIGGYPVHHRGISVITPGSANTLEVARFPLAGHVECRSREMRIGFTGFCTQVERLDLPYTDRHTRLNPSAVTAECVDTPVL